MEAAVRQQPAAGLAPLAPGQRIAALDVVRGFALLGIMLMNIEFFNRSTRGITEGMPLGLTGLDWAASWFIAYFVQGKFWTIFSLLFGMGFAVMMTRAERAGRDFLGPYLRRVGALAVFGAAHYIFLWDGDILFSYAVAAGALLVLLYGKWKYILMAVVPLVGLGFVPDFEPVFGIAGMLLFVGLNSLYLRGERKVKVRGQSLPLYSFILLLIGAAGVVAALGFWFWPDAPKEPRVPLTMAGVGILVVAFLSARFHDPVELRGLRMGVTIYLFMAVMMTVGGAVQYLSPREPAEAVTTAPDRPQGPAAAASQPAAAMPASAALAGKDGAKNLEKTEAEKKQEAAAARAKRLATRQDEARNEVRVMSSGSYLDTVELRARKFPLKVAFDAGFSNFLVAMFLLGVWFVRSGVMENSQANLPLFRKLAWYGLPVGIGLGLLGSLVAVSATPGDAHDGFQMARGLAVLGNLPACLGYVGLVVVMLHSDSVFARIRVLAPFGRMALTNYLMQSVICSFYFFGYGLGSWGMARAWQVLFVAVVLCLQVGFSHWWLARYRFGPMEWLWRGLTYRQTPLMRI